MIAADALSHVAHKSTVENRRKHLDVLIIGAPFFCLWCSMALWAKSGLLGQGECWRIHFKQNLVVTSRAGGLQAELAALHFADQLVAAGAADLFAIASFIEGMLCTRQQSAGTHLWPSTRTREGP